MKSQVIFSIVIPIFKRREMATEAINSVLDQIGIYNNDIEIILVEDETNKVIIKSNRKYYQSLSKNISYYLNRNEEGPGGARQTGLSVSRGKYLLFLDSDDILTSNYLRKMSETISDSNSVAVLCLSHVFFDDEFNLISKIKSNILCFIRDFFLIFSYLINNKNLYIGAFYLPQFSHVIFKRKYIQNIKFNYDYRRGGEDWDFFAKSLLKGNMKILPERLLLFKYSIDSSTSNLVNLSKKWESYNLLVSRLPKKFKLSIFYLLFRLYINSFSHL